MWPLQIRVLAKNDVQDIVDYYDGIAHKITDNFLNDLFADFDLIQDNPNSFQVKYRETRVRYMKRFPFGIHYILQENTIVVLAILHTGRNPKIWEER